MIENMDNPKYCWMYKFENVCTESSLFNYLKNNKIYRKYVLNTKCIFHFPVQLLFKTFLCSSYTVKCHYYCPINVTLLHEIPQYQISRILHISRGSIQQDLRYFMQRERDKLSYLNRHPTEQNEEHIYNISK
jgi:hypothetical protein